MQNILIATGRNHPLTKLLKKSTARRAAGLSSCHQKIFAIRRVFKKKPRRDALFKKEAVHYATRKVQTSEGEIPASYKRKKLLEILKIGKEN